MEVRFEVEGERSLERSRFRREVDWLGFQGLLDLKIKFKVGGGLKCLYLRFC